MQISYDIVQTLEIKYRETEGVFNVGAMNLAGFLAKSKIHYGSPESIEFTDLYFMLLNYWTLKESNNIARERQEAFYEFDKSEYANGEYFKRYQDRIVTREDIKHDAVKELFTDIDIPTKDDWNALQESIEREGLVNAYRLAVAP